MSATTRPPMPALHCDYCGGTDIARTCTLEGHPEIQTAMCKTCLKISASGTPLAKAAMLLRYLERESHRAHREYIAALPGLTRNQRRRLRRAMDADIPAHLEYAIQTFPWLAPLRRGDGDPPVAGARDGGCP